MQYLVVFERTPTSVGAFVPDLPGCVAAAESYDEARTLIGEAIAFHIEGMREENLEVPEPSATAEMIEVAA